MPRYELSEGTAHKFWEITLAGASFTTTYGRIGTAGQSTEKEFDSEAKAKAEHDKLVAEKVKKGYRLATGAGGAPAPSATPAAKNKASAPAKGAAPFDDEGDEEDAPRAPKGKPPAAAPAPKVKAAAAPKAGAAGARYFEFVDGASSKFWEIALAGARFTTRFGKIGTGGQESVKEWESGARAQKEYDKLVAEKVKKGYVEK